MESFLPVCILCYQGSLSMVVMMGVLFEPDATVSARTRAGLIQVNINFRVSQGPSSTIADCLPSLHEPYGFLCNELHRAKWVWLEAHCSLLESWSRTWSGTRTLACRPGCGIVWGLLSYWRFLLLCNSSIVGFDSSSGCRCRSTSFDAF